MKKIILIFLLISATLFAEINDIRLLRYPEVKQWSQDSDTNGESAYNIGVLYQQTIKDNKKAYKMDDKGASGSSASNLGYIYNNVMNKPNKAIEWYKKALGKNDKVAMINIGLLYKKAYDEGNIKGAHGLALLYEETLKNQVKAIKWYKKAARGGYPDSIKNLARYYKLDKNDNITGGAYFLALIDLKYPKQKVITYLKIKWKLTDEEIKKSYQLQKTLDIPKHYYDKGLEDETASSPKKKAGRR